MANSHPNVLFLSVDALRADRTSLHGYPHNTTPNLVRLAKRAIVCDQASSLAAFTQPSYPSLLTSSRPLSCGGYDHGAFGRPATAFEAFHNAGYETYAFSTFQWISRIAGYDRGIDHEIYLFVLNTLVGVASVILRNQIEHFRDGGIDAEQLAQESEPHLLRLFDTVRFYCKRIDAQSANDMSEFENSQIYNESYDYKKIQRIVDAHQNEFLKNKAAYVQRYFPKPFVANEWLGMEWRYARSNTKLIREAFFRASNTVMRTFDSSRAQLREMALKRYVDGGELADRLIRAIREHSTDKPFFIWTHFLDTHVPYCPGRGRDWYRKTPDYLEAVGHNRDQDIAVAVCGRPQTPEQWKTWSDLYDASVYYVDEQIGRILDMLDETGLSENTIIALCGDHGEELGDHGDISHHFRFYSHNVHVPMMIAAPGMTNLRVSALTTLMDLVPTMANAAGIPMVPEWEGEDITSASVSERSQVVLESFHGGSCAFDIKPVYMAVRDGRYNYLWKEYLDPSDRYSADTHELYDTTVDRAEKNNIYDPNHPAVSAFDEAIKKRLTAIPEISSERIEVAFTGHASKKTTLAAS
ncbi:MAG: sulfatase-like hydrolase/transferase [Rhodospirillaceae bacterium]|jgi:arylsulfatase A-like enzyme